jgi:hypothetical protein
MSLLRTLQEGKGCELVVLHFIISTVTIYFLIARERLGMGALQGSSHAFGVWESKGIHNAKSQGWKGIETGMGNNMQAGKLWRAHDIQSTYIFYENPT